MHMMPGLVKPTITVAANKAVETVACAAVKAYIALRNVKRLLPMQWPEEVARTRQAIKDDTVLFGQIAARVALTVKAKRAEMMRVLDKHLDRTRIAKCRWRVCH